MYKLCKTERSAVRQRKLELGFLALLRDRRYEEVNVSELCEHLQIPRKAFYRYFSGKEGVLMALLDHTILEYEQFPGNYRSGEARTIEKDLERFFLFWQSQKDLLDMLERNRLSAILIQRCVETSMSGTPIPMRFARTGSEDGRRALLMFTLCGLMSMVLDWHHNGFRTSAAYLGTLAARMLDAPLFSPLPSR